MILIPNSLNVIPALSLCLKSLLTYACFPKFYFHSVFSVAVSKEEDVKYMVMYLMEQGWRWEGTYF